MNSALAHDRPAVDGVRQDAVVPRERGVGESKKQGRLGVLNVIFYAAAILLLGLSMVGVPAGVYPQLSTAVAIFLFALAFQGAGGAAVSRASTPPSDERQ